LGGGLQKQMTTPPKSETGIGVGPSHKKSRAGGWQDNTKEEENGKKEINQGGKLMA